ncbi:hypothetical protein [Bradyrhizobium sp. McL0616]|uniref:hypothetical protein n=1 Tax=Bradyrhizobium sp. McL0616 TaxID=3415674 RepID=UPI003CE7399D
MPELQEFPAPSSQLLVKEIVRNVHCEVKRAITAVINDDKRLAAINGQRLAPWLEKWGVQIQLTLQVDEKGAVAPTLTYTPNPVSALFSLGAGAAVSTQATRIDILHSFYTVQDIYRLPKNCSPADPAQGSFLLESDLKLRQWLADTVLSSSTGDINPPTKPDDSPMKEDGVISHEVKFEVDTSGAITPTWKLTQVSINPDAPFLSASRNRVHDLLITLGPTSISPLTGKRVPSVAAANSQLSSSIGLAVSNGVRNTIRP